MILQQTFMDKLTEGGDQVSLNHRLNVILCAFPNNLHCLCSLYSNIYIYVCVLSWKQCVLPVITTKALWQLMHLVPMNQRLLNKLSKEPNISSHQWSTTHSFCDHDTTHKAFVVVTRRAHCFHDNIYIMYIWLLWDLSALCTWARLVYFLSTLSFYIYILQIYINI